MKNRKNIIAPLTAIVAGAMLSTALFSDKPSTFKNTQPVPEINIKLDSTMAEQLNYMIDPLSDHISDSASIPLMLEDMANNKYNKESKPNNKRDSDGFKVYVSKKDSTHYKSLTNKILEELHPDVFTDVVSLDFIKGNYSTESRFNPNAKSRNEDNSVLAAGTGQITKGTWNARGYNKVYGRFEDNILDPEKNIPASVEYKLYLEQLLANGADKYDEGLDKLWNTRTIEEKQALVLISYNQGPYETKRDLKKAHYNFKELQKYISGQSKNHVTRVFAYMNYLQKEENAARMAYLIVTPNGNDSTGTSGATQLNKTLKNNIRD